MELVGIDCLEVKDLFVDFTTDTGVFHAVKGVSLTVERGKISVIVGESGSGKSVTSLAIMDLLSKNGRITGGEILVDGTDLRKLSRKERQKLLGTKLGMIFQDSYSALNPKFRVRRLLKESLILHGVKDAAEQEKRILKILEEVELPSELLDRFPSELSGGQRQRVMIAMALLQKPTLLIADEPVSALDVAISESIIKLLKKLSRERNVAILFISHDLRTVYSLCDKVCVMKEGRIIEEAPRDELYANPREEYTKLLLRSALE